MSNNVEEKGIQNGKNSYTYKLPANIRFGLTALINTASTHTITVYVDGKPQDQVLSGTSRDSQGGITSNFTLGGIYHSGGGEVKIEVLTNGKPVNSSKFAYGIFEKEPGLAVFATEDGTDNDFNDSIVILNWPLG